MYHSSLFSGIPRDLGVYVLRRDVSPYFSKTGTRRVQRVGVVGYSGDVKQTLGQYFCEHTRTAMTANIRNTAMAVREQITHIDCYFNPDIMVDKIHAMAFERILTNQLEPMFRPPQDSDNIAKEAAEIAKDHDFRTKVLQVIEEPMFTIRLPNRDNIIADLLEMDSGLYGLEH